MENKLNKIELGFNYENMNVGDLVKGNIELLNDWFIYLNLGFDYSGFIDILRARDNPKAGVPLTNDFKKGDSLEATIIAFNHDNVRKLVVLSLLTKDRKINDNWNVLKNNFKIGDRIPCVAYSFSGSENIYLYFSNNKYIREFFLGNIVLNNHNQKMKKKLKSLNNLQSNNDLNLKADKNLIVNSDDSFNDDIFVKNPDVIAEIVEFDNKNKKVQFNLVSIVDKK